MSRLIVLIDSSTKPADKTTKYGDTTIGWAAWWEKVTGMPVRAEAIFLRYEGPNKAFYDGVIRILQSVRYLCHKEDHLEIYGDCQVVIDHINDNKHTSDKLSPWYNQVKKIEGEYSCPIIFKYVVRSNVKYKRLDQLTKNARGLFTYRTQSKAP